MEFHSTKDIRGHLYWNDFDANYQQWIWHGEFFEYGAGTSSKFENVDVQSIDDDTSN